MNLSILSGLLPDLITTVQVEFSSVTGAEKQAQVILLLQKMLTAMGVGTIWIQGVVALANFLIPLIVARFNKDPNNTLFVSSTTTPSTPSQT